MSLWVSIQHNNDRLEGTLANLMRGTGAATIKVFSGTRPVGGGAETTHLCTFTLADPPGEVDTDLSKLIFTTPRDALVLVDGLATWCRVFDGDGGISMDGDVSDEAGSGDVKLETTDLQAGGVVRLISAEMG